MIEESKRITKMLLILWRRDTENLTNRLAKRRLKMLYAALNTLSESERQFLWDKYYRLDANNPFSDEVMAKKYGISKNEYSKKRVAIERRMSPVVVETEKKIKVQEQKDRQEAFERWQKQLVSSRINP